MNQNETQWDKLLKIKTTGRDDSNSDQYRYPYEPTFVMVLSQSRRLPPLSGGENSCST